MQQAAVQHLVQGSQSVFFFEIGHLTEVPKGDSPVEDGSCRQKCKGMRRESIQSGTDDFAHTGGKDPLITISCSIAAVKSSVHPPSSFGREASAPRLSKSLSVSIA